MYIPMIDLFIKVRMLDVVDILLVAFLLYEIYNLVKGTAAIRIFLGIVAIFVAWRIVRILQMELLSEILGAFISVGFIALIVVFQPEIRKFLLMLGNPTFINRRRRRFFFWKVDVNQGRLLDIMPIVNACNRMSSSKTGALIVLAQNNALAEYVETGELLDARITEQMIESIFFKNSPLHDGALIIIDNRLNAARCVLPVSISEDLPAHLGLRHRAAIGITERSDAVAITVSEQTGKISFCKEGELRTDVSIVELKAMLDEEFSPL